MGLTSAGTASPSHGSVQYAHECLAQYKTRFAKLDDKYVQREEFVTSLEAPLADM